MKQQKQHHCHTVVFNIYCHTRRITCTATGSQSDEYKFLAAVLTTSIHLHHLAHAIVRILI